MKKKIVSKKTRKKIISASNMEEIKPPDRSGNIFSGNVKVIAVKIWIKKKIQNGGNKNGMIRPRSSSFMCVIKQEKKKR